MRTDCRRQFQVWADTTAFAECRSRAVPLAVVLFGGLVALPSAESIAWGQARPTPAIRIRSAIVCTTCRIEVASPSITLVGTPAHDVAPTPTVLAIDHAGRLIAPRGANGIPMVFSRTGHLLAEIGRTGDGPGEYRFPTLATFGPSDSAAIVDVRAARITVLTPDLRFARSFHLDSSTLSALEWLPNGGFVLAAAIRTPQRVGHAMHLLDPSGSIIASLGEGDAVVGPRTPDRNRLLQAVGTGFYAVDALTTIRVEYWENMTLRRRWQVDSPFFPDQPPPGDKRPFASRLTSFHVDDHGILFLLTSVPRPNWRDGVKSRQENGQEVFDIVDREKLISTVVEAIDLTSGQVLARLRTDRVLQGFLKGGYAYRHQTSDAGQSRYLISRVRLVR